MVVGFELRTLYVVSANGLALSCVFRSEIIPEGFCRSFRKGAQPCDQISFAEGHPLDKHVALGGMFVECGGGKGVAA